MHYQHPDSAGGLHLRLEPVDRFLKEMGVREATPQARYAVTSATLPAQLHLVLLTPQPR
jgi:hypothetical protein